MHNRFCTYHMQLLNCARMFHCPRLLSLQTGNTIDQRKILKYTNGFVCFYKDYFVLLESCPIIVSGFTLTYLSKRYSCCVQPNFVSPRLIIISKHVVRCTLISDKPGVGVTLIWQTYSFLLCGNHYNIVWLV